MALKLKRSRPHAFYPGEQIDGSYVWRTPGAEGRAVSVDPGLEGTGWAVWDRSSWDDLAPPVASGCLKPAAHWPARWQWWQVADGIAQNLQSICQRFDVRAGYVEKPMFMEGGRGIVSARDDALVKLTATFGIVVGKCGGPHRPFCPVPIPLWKGQTKSTLIESRIRKRFPKLKTEGSTDHEIDAIGIGLYCKGHM